MIRARIALCVAILAAATGAGYAAGAEPPYSKRLQILEALASRYPGQVESRAEYGKYGLWAGIVVQTVWQQQTQRDRNPLWAIVNYTLSVEPTTYARMLERAGPSADAQTACALNLERDVCEGWVRYFLGVRQGLSPATLLKQLWHAHTTAIVHVLRSHRAQLDAVKTTALERRFWSSWIEIVFLLEASRFPTDGVTSERASALLMPPCAPLGSAGCPLKASVLGRSFAFVSLLARRRSSVDRALREYTTLRQDPAAIRTLAFADPALAAALGLYLAVPR